MPKVRTTMQPLVELNVTDKEYADLKAQGVVLDSTATTRDALMKDATEQSAARPSPTGVDVELTDDDEVAPVPENLTTVGGNTPDDEQRGEVEFADGTRGDVLDPKHAVTDIDIDTDDEDETALDDTETKE